MNRNILFIGDLVPANNYGAIATSECLKRMVEDCIPGNNIRYIDHRSFRNPTPAGGWPVYKNKNKDPYVNLKAAIKYYLPISMNIWKAYNKVFRKKKAQKFLPEKLSEYDSYANDILDGRKMQYELALLRWSDIVYINAEGNIVNGTDEHGVYRTGGRYVLFLAYFASKYLKKRCCIVNHTIDPANRDIYDIIKVVYPLMDYIYVREMMSLKKLDELGIRNVSFVPDALFSYKGNPEWQPSGRLSDQIDFTKPYICLGDSSGIRSDYSQVRWSVYDTYCDLIDKLRRIVPQIVIVDGFTSGHREINRVIRDKETGRLNLNNCDYHELFQVLKRSELFISGRWHNSILSVLAGTPIILWGADSHKTEALYRLLDYPYRFFDIKTIPINTDDIALEAERIIKEKPKMWGKIDGKVEKLRKLSYGNVACIEKMIRK